MRTLNFRVDNNHGMRRGNADWRIIRPFFNGMDVRNYLYTGGPVTAADANAVLRAGVTDVPSVEGCRYATTVAEGAALGPELITNAANREFNSDTGFWTKTGNASISGGVCLLSSTANQGIIAGFLVIGKRYFVSYEILSAESNGVLVKVGATAAAANTELGVKTEELVCYTDTLLRFYSANTATSPVIDNISVREVIPQWLDTDTEGADLYASTLVRGQKLYTDADPTEFPRIALWGASTNYFLNSQTPVTQNITTTAQQYTVSVIGSGSVTLSGTATGVATEGSPLTVTATAGTLTCTVADTLTHVQVEVGAYATPPIYTGATTVTRPNTRLVGQSAGVLRGNNLALMGQVIPGASGQSGVVMGSLLDANNMLSISHISGTSLILYKTIAGVHQTASVALTTVKGVPFQWQVYLSSTYGMGIRVRSWLGVAWSAWTAWSTNANTQDAPITSTFEIGSRNDGNRFVGNYQMFLPYFTNDPKTYLENLEIAA